MKVWAEFLFWLTRLFDAWSRNREQSRRQGEDEKIADDPGDAFDDHFGGVPRVDNATAPDKADAGDDKPPG